MDPLKKKTPRRSVLWRRPLRWLLLCIVCFYSLVLLSLAGMRWFDPPTTAVQTERRVASWFTRQPYRKSYSFASQDRMSPALQHAVVAAEDARFFAHHGFDWREVQNAVQDDLNGGRSRGASTITQQLVRNLFLSTGRSFVRKGVEFTIVPLAELLLSKRRLLELYLNVVEWGPGVYGAEAAAQHYYGIPARRVSRAQAAELASLLPSPLRRKPGRQPLYTSRILERMGQMGW